LRRSTCPRARRVGADRFRSGHHDDRGRRAGVDAAA
jgi:hypothetical protein